MERALDVMGSIIRLVVIPICSKMPNQQPQARSHHRILVYLFLLAPSIAAGRREEQRLRVQARPDGAF